MLEDINDATSEWVLLWAQRIEPRQVQMEALDKIKRPRTWTQLDTGYKNHNNMRHKKHKEIESCKCCRIGHPRDRGLSVAKHGVVLERETTSVWCVGQFRKSSKGRNYQGMAGQSMMSGGIRSPNQ